MTALSDRVCSAYLSESVRRNYAYDFDPGFRAEFTELRQNLDHVDAAMTKAGDDEQQRLRTLTALIAGPPDTEAAFARLHDREVAVAEALNGKPTGHDHEPERSS